MTDTPETPPGGQDPAPERFADDAHRYRLDSRIATGGMGEVWRATDTTLGREVAVKLLKHEFADDATFRSRFETEARHAAALHHPGVAGVWDFGEAAPTDGSGMPRPFLVMELVDGKPLSDLLRGGRPLDPEVSRDLLAQAADAVAAAHAAGIVHRDIKPANLLVTPDRRIKITDFGIARAADGVGITQTGQVMGTPQYLSPEQARGYVATTASDVYSLGVVAFECLVGRRPFEAESPIATALAHLQQPVPDLPPEVPADLAAVVRRALAKEPAERYPDAAAFAAALRDPTGHAALAPPTQSTQLLTGVAAAPVVAGAVPDFGATVATPVPPPLDERRSPWPAVLGVLALVAAVVVLIVLLTGGDDDPADQVTDQPTTSRSPSRPTSAPTTSESSAPQTVEIDESDYLGRPVDDVVAELESLGLEVSRSEVENQGDQDAGAVESVNPSGTLTVGDAVQVRFYGEPATSEPPPSPSEPTTAPTTAPTTPTTSAPTTPASPGSSAPATSSAASPTSSTSPNPASAAASPSASASRSGSSGATSAQPTEGDPSR